MIQANAYPLADLRQSRAAAASGLIGSTLEFYDFLIYAAASALVFPQLFFPSVAPSVAIIASLATYGAGYVIRPIGAIVLGHLGDTIGRKTVLLISMFLMGMATFSVGLLPTYQQVGVFAPISLVLLRFVQGFAVAGEISGATSMVLEHAPFGRRGFFASFALQGATIGQLIAAAAFLPMARYLPATDFLAWGWRIPFLLSAVVLVVGYFIRRNVNETPVFAEEGQRGTVPKAPIREALRHSWDDMIRVGCMAMINVINVVATVFGTAYAVQPAYGIGMSKDLFLWIPIASCAVGVVVFPIVGRLSDSFGRRPLIIGGALSSGLLSFAFLYAIQNHNPALTLIFAALMWGVFYNGYGAAYPAFFPELFAARYRVSAMAVATNVGVALTAMLPGVLVAVAPPGSPHIPLTIGVITFGVTLLGAVAAFTARETFRVPMAELGRRDAAPMAKPEYDRLRVQNA